MAGFIKAMRSEEAAFLDMNPNANHLLNVIARRARRSPCGITGLDVGECFIGHKGVGLTEQEYRTAKKNLEKWQLANFRANGRRSGEGTIAKLLNTNVYDINSESEDSYITEDATEEQRKSNGRATEEQRKSNDKQRSKNLRSEKSEEQRSARKAALDFSAWPRMPSDQVMTDYKKLRASKKAPITQTVINKMAGELIALEQSGVDVDQALSICCERGWQGLKSDWVLNHLSQNGVEYGQGRQGAKSLSAPDRVAIANGINPTTGRFIDEEDDWLAEEPRLKDVN